MIPNPSEDTVPIATKGNTLETKMTYLGSGMMKGADVDTSDVAIEEMSEVMAVPVKCPVDCNEVATVTIGVTDTAVDWDKVHTTCNGYL